MIQRTKSAESYRPDEGKEILLKANRKKLTDRARDRLTGEFTISEDVDTYEPTSHEAVVVDYDFYRDNINFLRDLNSQDDILFNPMVLIANGKPEQSLPDYPVDTFHEIHDVGDQNTDLTNDLRPLIAVRKLTKQLAGIDGESSITPSNTQNPSRKRFKRYIYQFQATMEKLNPRLYQHSRRTARYASILAKELSWSTKQRENLYISTLLHDIGKMAIPDPILYKPDSLSDDEFRIVKDHPSRGYECMPEPESELPLLSMLINVTRHHHERWNGDGYPDGISGEDIPLSARVVAITDVFDAVTHDRVYRDRMREDEALNLIRQKQGSHFDPELVEDFFRVLPHLREVD